MNLPRPDGRGFFFSFASLEPDFVGANFIRPAMRDGFELGK